MAAKSPVVLILGAGPNIGAGRRPHLCLQGLQGRPRRPLPEGGRQHRQPAKHPERLL